MSKEQVGVSVALGLIQGDEIMEFIKRFWNIRWLWGSVKRRAAAILVSRYWGQLRALDYGVRSRITSCLAVCFRDLGPVKRGCPVIQKTASEVEMEERGERC